MAQPNAGCHPVMTKAEYDSFCGTPEPLLLHLAPTPAYPTRLPDAQFHLDALVSPAVRPLPDCCSPPLSSSLIPCTWQFGVLPSTTEDLAREPTLWSTSRTIKLRSVLAHQSLARELRLVTTINQLFSQRLKPPHVGTPLGPLR